MKKKILKISAYILGSILVLLTAFHFWFINHAERLLEELVDDRSNGKIRLQVKKFRFNWFSTDMQLRQAVFYSTDTSTTAYRFSVERMNVSVKEVWPLVFEKRVIIDSLTLINPDILVTRLRPAKDDSTDNKSASLPQEMGRIYKSIQDALEVLKVSQFHIDNGRFTLVNKVRPEDLPVTITNLQLHLDNLKVDSTDVANKQKILFSDNISLQTHKQDILFPDGRHKLSFSKFGINIQKRMVEFDSCTVSASKGDSAKTSFQVFFDKLRLTNIDFDTLYQKEVIKADSVYCINPRFTLNTELEKKAGSPKPPPKLNELVQQLTGDLQVEYVVVENGSFNINTVREGRPSSFTSSHNNFEMQGLSIEKNSPNPLKVKSLVMAIRNYENFLRDSTYALTFDSILLVNNSINLSNFTLKQMQQDNVVNSFSMPQFQLRSFSWDDIVFDQKLSAGQATLNRPVINYSFITNKGKDKNVFETLAGFGSIIQLNKLDVLNGQINLHFTNGAQLKLENASLSLAGKEFVQSKQIVNLQKSVKGLHFKKGTLRSGNLTIELENADISGKEGKLLTKRMLVTDKEKNITLNASDVSVNAMQIDEKGNITEINGIQWKEADIVFPGGSTTKTFTGQLLITNILGNNTKFSSSAGDQQLSAYFEILSSDELLLQPGKPVQLKNFRSNGTELSFKNKSIDFKSARFRLSDNKASELEEILFRKISTRDTVSVNIPAAGFIPDINTIISGKIKADELVIRKPVISIKHYATDNNSNAATIKWPAISIPKISIDQPELLIEQPGSSGFSKIEWHTLSNKSNSLVLTGLRITEGAGIFADKLLFAASNFLLTSGEKTFRSGNGEIKAEINNFYVQSSEAGEQEWHATIKDLQAANFTFPGLGKNQGKLEMASVNISNFDISSGGILNWRRLFKENSNFRLSGFTGNYENTKDHFEWENAGYNRVAKEISLSSFTYHPALAKDDFMKSRQFQADHTTLKTGAINVNNFSLAKYLTDSIAEAGTATINNAVLENFRDKRMPFQHGVTKPLPVNLLKQLSVKLDIGHIRFVNANATYSELNDKTDEIGTVRLSSINGSLSSVNNYAHTAGDSLRINARGYIMDSFRLELSYQQSYTDPLGGFVMRTAMGSADARILNPIVMPLASLKIGSGIHDSLIMVSRGDDNSAKGEIKMLYHDLKIKLLNNNNKDAKKRTGSKGFMSFIANAFIVKSKNRSRTISIEYERNKERSLFHYFWKTTLRGITRSIGLKKDQLGGK
ncbi:MAG: hypothetical protein JNN00_06115 [Chitinophagaceae bacterium]|nr:hypothetical protein [Chitinophagaceae bacterium]